MNIKHESQKIFVILRSFPHKVFRLVEEQLLMDSISDCYFGVAVDLKIFHGGLGEGVF